MGITLKNDDIVFLDTAPFIYFFEMHPDYFPALEVFFDQLYETVDIADHVVELRATYNFKTPDAIQIGSAVACGADFIITNDKSWQRFDEIKVIMIEDL